MEFKFPEDNRANLRKKEYQTHRVQYEINSKNKRIKLYKKLFNNLSVQMKKLTRTNPIQTKTFMYYVRYADDWILLNNRGIDFCTRFQDKIDTWLKTNLHLELCKDKTKITDFRKTPVKFLGFTLFIRTPKITRIERITNLKPVLYTG